MTNEERRDVDVACLRILGIAQNEDHPRALFEMIRDVDGYTLRSLPLSPSTDPSLIVPLAEALRRRGWSIIRKASAQGPWTVQLLNPDVPSEHFWFEQIAESEMEALAVAAARAMERSGEE